jgi:hypothetical protein
MEPSGPGAPATPSARASRPGQLAERGNALAGFVHRDGTAPSQLPPSSAQRRDPAEATIGWAQRHALRELAVVLTVDSLRSGIARRPA